MATKATGFIEFDIIGNERGVQQMLDAVNSALSVVGLAQFLHGAVGPWVKQRAADRFKSEGDDVTGKWAPLADTTVAIREGMGYGGQHPINKRTGQLEDYITSGNVGVSSGPGLAVLTYPDNPPSSPSLRQKVETAQVGRTSPSTPPRPILGLNERDLVQVMTMLAFHVQREGLVRRAGR